MKKVLGVCLLCTMLVLTIQLVSNHAVKISGTAYAWPEDGNNCAKCHASIKAAPKSIKFEATKVNGSSTREILILNKGGNGGVEDLLVDTGNITFTGAAFSEFNQTNDCNDYLPYLSTCTITVTASPTDYGKRVAGLIVPSNDVKTYEIIIPLSVDAKPPKIKTKPSSISFSTTPAGTSSTKSLTISNGGLSDLIIAGALTPTGTDADDFLIQPSSCLPIPKGESCTLEITYSPSVAKTSTAQIEIISNDQIRSPKTVKLKGKSK